MAVGKVINPSQIPQINNIKSGELHSVGSTKQENPAASFKNMITSGIEKVNESVKAYEATSNQFAHGESVNLHEMMLKGENADLNLRMMAVLRNKIVSAYKEVMSMGV